MPRLGMMRRESVEKGPGGMSTHSQEAMLVERVTSDPENDLRAMVDRFEHSNDSVWHIDRHVLASDGEGAADWSLRDAACVAAVALARMWLGARLRLPGSVVLVSVPRAIIDDEWLSCAAKAAPPHVYVCLTRDPRLCAEAVSGEATAVTSSGIRVLDALHAADVRLLRVGPALEAEPGGWYIEFIEK